MNLASVGGNRQLFRACFGQGDFTRRLFTDAVVEGMQLEPCDLSSPARAGETTKGADAVIVVTEPLTRLHVESLPDSVKVIGRAGIGLDALDLGALEHRGIAVLNLPDYATEEVATHTVALVLAWSRALVMADTVARTAWSDWQRVPARRPLDELTVGVVGTGRIGRAVLRKLAPLVGKCLAYDEYADAVPEGAERVPDLETLLNNSDVVSLHVPGRRDAEPLIDARALARMRADALLVNVSRGSLIDMAALLDALEGRRLGGAALDVLATEPPAVHDPVLRHPGVMLTPHVAWLSTRALERIRDHTLDATRAYLKGEALPVGNLALAGNR